MEGHSANFWNEIADQIQRNGGKEQQKMDQKSTKNLPKSVQNRSWKRSWRILGPSSPQESPRAPKMPKTAFADPPPGSKLGPKIHAKSTPKPSKCNFFLYLFSGRVRTPLWADLLRIRVRKWSKNRPKIDVQSDLAENAKSLKNLRFSYVF